MFSDLESSLPAGVRIKRISVRNVGLQNGRTIATLEMVVVSKNPADATEMIGEMDRAGVFRAELVEQNLKTERNETNTESTLEVNYLPRTGASRSETGENNVATANIIQAASLETR